MRSNKEEIKNLSDAKNCLLGSGDPNQNLSDLIESYLQKRKSQPGGLSKGFFQNESEAILKLCQQLTKQKNSSILEKIKLINDYLANASSPLENEFQNLLNTFFSNYKSLIPHLAPALQAKLQLKDTVSSTPEILTVLLQLLEVKDANQQAAAAHALSHLAKLAAEKDRERIAKSIFNLLKQSREKKDSVIFFDFLEALAEMGKSIPDSLLTDVLELLKNTDHYEIGDFFSRPQKDYFRNIGDKFSFITNNPTLRQDLKFFGETKKDSSKYTEFNFEKKNIDFNGKPPNRLAFTDFDLYPDNQQEKMFEAYMQFINDPKQLEFYEETGPLLSKFWNRIPDQNKKFVANTLIDIVNGKSHSRSLYNIGSATKTLEDLGDLIPENVRQSFVADWVKRYMNTPHTENQIRIIHLCLLPFFDINIIPNVTKDNLYNLLLGNLSTLDAHERCVRLLVKLAPSLTQEQRFRLIENLLSYTSQGNPAPGTHEYHNLMTDMEAITVLWKFASPDLSQKITVLLIECCCSENAIVQKAASNALIQIADHLDDSKSIALLSQLENKLRDNHGAIRPTIVGIMAEIIYKKEIEHLLTEKMGPSLAKVTIGKTR